MNFLPIIVVLCVLNFKVTLTNEEALADTFDEEDDFNSTLIDFKSKLTSSKFRKRHKQWLIIGGAPTSVEDVPYQASIKSASSTNPSSEYLCGGTVLTEDSILTAAHCLTDTNSDYSDVLPYGNIEIRTGSSQPNSGGQVHQVTNVYLPPGLGQVKDYTSGWDLAVVKVTPAINFPGAVGSVQIPDSTQSANFMNMVENEEECTLSGFGMTETGQYSPQLMTTKVKLLNYDWCRSMSDRVGVVVREQDHICTYDNKEEGACSGDSGGGLICGKGATKTIWGVAAYVYNCATTAPTLYIRVDTKADFIRSSLEQNKGSKKSVTDKLQPSSISATLGVLFHLVVFVQNKHSLL